MLDQVLKLFIAEEIEYKSDILPIVRLDIDKYDFMLHQAGLNFDSESRIYLFFKGEYFNYNKGYHLNLFLSFVNRHLYPVVMLKTKEDVDEFRDTSHEWMENTPFYKNLYRYPLFTHM